MLPDPLQMLSSVLNGIVLILVVMEDAPRLDDSEIKEEDWAVLILVVMEDAPRRAIH